MPQESSHDGVKLDVLRSTVRDLLLTEPDDTALEDEPGLQEVYAELHNLKTALDGLPVQGREAT